MVGAVLLLGDAVSGPADLTWVGGLARARDRLAASVALVGSVMVLTGSLVLVVVAGVSWLAVLVVLAFVAVAVPSVMAAHLRSHLRDRAGPSDPIRSWWWCFRHVLWAPRDGP